jgi:hypothetical protein
VQDRLAVDISYEDLHAYHDKMSKTLRLTGTCHIKGGGFAVELVPAKPRGINDRMLHFEIRVTPTGESPSTQALEYSRPWDANGIQYLEVEFSIDVDAKPPSPLKIEELE